MGIVKDYIEKKHQKAEQKLMIGMYERSYNESRVKKPQLPDLKDFAELKKSDPEAYIEKIDSLAHMKASIDSAYAHFKETQYAPMSAKDVYYYVGTKLHDDWCKNNTFKFTDPARADRKWQFLSSEAIGWPEFKKDMKYVAIVVETIHPDCAYKDLEPEILNLYREKRSEWVLKPDEEKTAYEATRWISLSNQNNPPYLLPAFHKYIPKDIFVDGTGHDWSNVVGEPYKIKEYHDNTYIEYSDAVNEAIHQVTERMMSLPSLQSSPSKVEDYVRIEDIRASAEKEAASKKNESLVPNAEQER